MAAAVIPPTYAAVARLLGVTRQAVSQRANGSAEQRHRLFVDLRVQREVALYDGRSDDVDVIDAAIERVRATDTRKGGQE